MERVREAADRIKRLEVQGATNVALTAMKALVEQMKASQVRDIDSALHEIAEAKEILFKSRETEPFMRNAIRYIEWGIARERWETTSQFHRLIHSLSEDLLNKFKEARDRIIEVGSKRVLDGSRVLTHCHSSAVSGILKVAKEKGVDFEVVLTETRPVYQGRITAREMLESGVRTTMIVDSAVRSFMTKVDLALVGADAITSEGNIINKIGTSLLALAAHEARTPFYVASELLKFDPQTIHGDYEAIEERSPEELWPQAPQELEIRNPAFDVTRRDYIHGIISEEGLISPHSIMEAVRRRYPWILEALGG
ncbi:MAG: S-methyl-5-thioribose-1-phosphate isomerase [Candidatus Bathyarchaeota archaeon]|nr:MAG: S-methyl-5-thioribose-1-phosphate isomerase [Candidatus Bathyarchaeota archaeon]